MQLDDMTPRWARIIIPLAVLGFLAGGAASMVHMVPQAWGKDAWTMLVACLPGGILIYLGWRGVPLTRCLRFQAAISGDDLHHRRGPDHPVETTPLDDLRITRHPAMQLVHVDDARNGQRLFTADYVYRRACVLVEEIENRQRTSRVKPF